MIHTHSGATRACLASALARRVHTEVRVARNTAGQHGRATDRDVIEVIRELSKVCRDLTIAATLNRLGYRTGTGKTWRVHSVASVRYQYRLPNFAKGTDWLTRAQAAQHVGASATVLKRLIGQGYRPRAKWCRRPRGLSNGPIWTVLRSSRRCRQYAQGVRVNTGKMSRPAGERSPTWPSHRALGEGM